MEKQRILMLPIILCTAAIIAGCGKKEDDNTTLLKPADEGKVRVVKDFSAAPETEAVTEAVTEKQTEQVTEVETEAATEIETEATMELFSEDYDFSNAYIMSALFKSFGGTGSVLYTDKVTQDPEAMERIEEISALDGDLRATLVADRTSGSSNKSVKIEVSTGDAEELIRSILLSFENGITEDNIDGFMDGDYTGQSNAPFIGLDDSSISEVDGHYEAFLKKADVAEGDVPYWADVSLSLKDILPESFCSLKLESSDTFSDIFSGIDFGKVEYLSSGISSYTVMKDETGSIIDAQCEYSASYKSDSGAEYSISIPGDGNSKMRISVTGVPLLDENNVLWMAEHIIGFFYNDPIDHFAELPYENDHVSVARTKNEGFEIIFK